MDISGTSITPFFAKMLPDFQVMTRLAIKWKQMSSGNWRGMDRTSAEDKYEAEIGLYGNEAAISQWIDELEANRDSDTHTFLMDNFFSTEKIFGENVDYSGGITVTVMSWARRRQGSWKGWGVSCRVRATSISLTGSSSFPALVFCEPGVDADSDRRINKLSTYDNTLSFHDHASDSGLFTGIFTLTIADSILLRNYIQNQRTGNFTLADTFGVIAPFGTRSANSYPFTTKLIAWEDLGYYSTLYKKFSLTFAEAA